MLQEDAEAAAKQDIGNLGSGGLRTPPAMARISEEPSAGSRLGSAKTSPGSPPTHKPSLDSVSEGNKETLGPSPDTRASRSEDGKAELAKDAVCGLLGSSATAQKAQQPKGLGRSQGLPTKKRPSSAKSQSASRSKRLKDEGPPKVDLTMSIADLTCSKDLKECPYKT